MEIPDHLTCLLRNLYAGQEAIVRTGHGTTDWFQIGKGVCQGCILSLCLFNLYAEYIMRNARLAEAQAGIKIARRNINNLRYADDTTLMAESEEELKSVLMKVKVVRPEQRPRRPEDGPEQAQHGPDRTWRTRRSSRPFARMGFSATTGGARLDHDSRWNRDGRRHDALCGPV